MTFSKSGINGSKRRRKMTASKWWLAISSLLLVIVLSLQPLAGDAVLSSRRPRTGAVRSSMTITPESSSETNRLLDGTDENIAGEEGEIKVEDEKDKDKEEDETANGEGEAEPPEPRGEGEPPEPSPPDDGGNDGDTLEPSPPDDEGNGGDEKTPAPTPADDEEDPPAPTTDEENDPPVESPGESPTTAEPSRPSPAEESPEPTPEPSAPQEQPEPPTDDESPAPTPEPTSNDETSSPEPTQKPRETEPPSDKPTRDPTPDEPEGTPSPVDEPAEELGEDSSQPSVELFVETSVPSDATATPRPTIGSVTSFPSVSPSLFPSSAPTVSVQPTDAPSPMPVPSLSISDNVSVLIKPVSGVMSAGNTKHFETTAMSFLADLLFQLEQPIYNVDVTVTGGNILTQRRRLQSDVLQVDMVVSGSFDPVSGLAETEDDYSIGRVSRQFFTVQGNSFVRQLKDTDYADDYSYFRSVSSVESVAVPGDDVTPAGTPAPPGPAPSTGPGLAIGGIVAVALVGALVVALGVALFVNNMRKRRRNDPLARNQESSFSTDNKKSSVSSAKKKSQKKKSSKRVKGPKNASPPVSPEKALSMKEAPPPVLTIGGPSSDRGSINRVDSDVNSDLQWGAESLIGAESNMSYAYSLEDGIHQSPSAESLGSGVNCKKDDETPVPKEIPNVSSDPSQEEDDDDELDIDKSWTPNSSSIVREITAPPGKLGVVLNTSEKGPVVQSIATGSPLEGMVWPGDVVVSIDGINAKRMSAASVNEYMSKNLFKSRKLTIMSDPDA